MVAGNQTCGTGVVRSEFSSGFVCVVAWQLPAADGQEQLMDGQPTYQHHEAGHPEPGPEGRHHPPPHGQEGEGVRGPQKLQVRKELTPLSH